MAVPAPVIVPLPVPAGLDAPDAWLLHGFVDTANTVRLDTWGDLDESRAPAEALAALRAQEYETRLRYLALDAPPADGPPDPARVLGCALVDLPRHDNTHLAWIDIAVRPEHRGRGLGGALYDRAVVAAHEEGRTVLTASTDHGAEPPAGPGTLVPSTGNGLVRATDPGVRFLVARGWQLEQVARRSVLQVPLDPAVLAARADTAARAAGPDYRVVLWDARCPDEWVDQFATLVGRMSTDAPAGGLDLQEEVWDAARIRQDEATHRARGMTERVAAAVHVPTQTLAAFTSLVSRPDTDEFVHQDDTLVLREHRGRRLGMLVKTANLTRLAQVQPGARRIGTWNAEENAPMLAINTELGFRPAGGSGEWQLTVG